MIGAVETIMSAAFANIDVLIVAPDDTSSFEKASARFLQRWQTMSMR
jgi:hypothetical protein